MTRVTLRVRARPEAMCTAIEIEFGGLRYCVSLAWWELDYARYPEDLWRLHVDRITRTVEEHAVNVQW